jgi:hypothetical protein
MLNINNRLDLFEKLEKLKADQQPLFGVMKPQHMVEHLIWTVTFCNGKLPQQQITTAEKALQLRELFMYSKDEYPRGIKPPMLADEPPPLVYPDLLSAINQLKKELDDFDKYFEAGNNTAINPALGMLNYEEWILVHNKHFTHHFTQFGLM